MTDRLIRFLTSMKLAVTLLVMLALASVIGTIVPQNLPFNEYIVRFGPFWAELFAKLGVFHVYSSAWFTTLLLFLVFSLSLCFSEQLGAFFRQRKSQPSLPIHAGKRLHCRLSLNQMSRWLRTQGFKTRCDDDQLYAWKGNSRKIGYFFLHGGLLVLLLGALIDTNPLLKAQLISGSIQPVPFQTPPDQVDNKAILPADSGAFRANINLRPGEKTDRVYLITADGYLVRKLPFIIAIDDFRIDYYATGMPKGYTTSLTLFDPDGYPLVQGNIQVNHPLTWKGYTLYQSTFDDGGSIIEFLAWRPGSEQTKKNTMTVGERITVTLGGKPWQLEILDFQLHTVVRRQGGQTLNHGPRMVYRLTSPQGRQIWLESFMTPRTTEQGRRYHIMGVKHQSNAPFQTLVIPLDETGESRFWAWLAQLAKLSGEDQKSLLVRLFTLGGFDAIYQFIDKNIEEKEHDSIKKFYTGILLHKLNETLTQVYPKADARWRNDAIMAADALFAHQIPLWLQMRSFEQKLETGLIVAHYPGKPLIWTGSLLLAIGVLMMLYTKPIQIWIHLEETSDRDEMKMVIKSTDNHETARWNRKILGLCKGPDHEHDGNQFS